LRIPARNLADVQNKTAGLGKLISQSSDESDVTQQHIDMSARLENLRAEETRLRALLDRAGKVTDLLAVERELSRVRGDIESMQAQLSYLENQAAMATLTLSLDQPGPVVRPSAGGWGLVDSVTTGIQAAAALIRELITAIIALSPLIVIGVLIWWLARRRMLRRRTQREALAAQTGAFADATAAAPVPDDQRAQAPLPPTPRD
jgi:ABC-type multidrug transport system fused ATPase/permease subunit